MDVTQVFAAVARGEEGAAELLLPLVYDELRRLAAARMAREPAGHTLQATALVHEVWLRLGADQQPGWKSRAQFFAAAAEAMRRILIDRARRRRAQRRGGEQERVEFDEAALVAPAAADDRILDVNTALDEFAALEPEKAELVKLRYFVGLSIEETAQALDISEATAKRWWAYARTWLYQRVHSGPDLPPPGAPAGR